MNPSAQEVLRSCVQNLEELVAPELQSPHAKSAMMCVRMLLNHVILRLDLEGQALAVDSAEKRELLSALVADRSVSDGLAEEIATMLGETEPAFTPIDELTARNEAWKKLIEKVLHNAGDGALRLRVRSQLVAQVARENAFCAPALDGPMF